VTIPNPGFIGQLAFKFSSEKYLIGAKNCGEASFELALPLHVGVVINPL